METITLNFKASGQNLTADAHPQRYASNTVNYIQAVFDLDDNWKSFDSVRAVWHNEFACISTVLDSDGACTVPHEVLTNLDEVIVNLVGSDVDGEELVDRMTTYPLRVAIIDAHARICGTETAEVTPSQFEQYVAIVRELVADIKDIDSVELNDDYTLTFYFSDGTETTVGPIRGEQGETGNGIASAVLNDDYTLTLNFTDDTSYTTSSIRGEQGPQGEPGEVTLAQLEQVLPTDTASGAIASFPDGSDLFDYLSCIVNIEPVQAGSGTPSPDNVRPITGWTGCEVDVSGVNLFDKNAENNLIDNAYVNNSTGAITASTGDKTIVSALLKAGTYTISKISSTRFRVGIFSSEPTIGSVPTSFVTANPQTATSLTITLSADSYLAIFVYNSSGESVTIEQILNSVQIENGSTATAYTPYNPNSAVYPVSWQTEAGTVYGGTVDVVTGVLFEGGTELVSHTLTDAEIDSATTYDYSGKHGIQISNVFSQNVIKGADGCCSSVSTVQAGASANAEYLWYGSSSGNKNVYWIGILDVLNMTLAEWKVWAKTQTIQLLYPITVPPTTLTPTQIQTLLGHNNVWADCGNVEVQYKADVQRWVEKMLNA